jgi:hypothetical protein
MPYRSPSGFFYHPDVGQISSADTGLAARTANFYRVTVVQNTNSWAKAAVMIGAVLT